MTDLGEHDASRPTLGDEEIAGVPRDHALTAHPLPRLGVRGAPKLSSQLPLFGRLAGEGPARWLAPASFCWQLQRGGSEVPAPALLGGLRRWTRHQDLATVMERVLVPEALEPVHKARGWQRR